MGKAGPSRKKGKVDMKMKEEVVTARWGTRKTKVFLRLTCWGY